MKKLIIFIGLVLFAFVAMAQERTVSITLANGQTRWDYTGTARDTLKEKNQDTIDFRMAYKSPEAIEKIDIFFQADTLAGNDSIYVSLLGKKELTGAATTLIASTGVLLNASNEINELTLYQTVSSDTVGSAIIATPVDISYQYYILRMIQDDNNDYDGGAKIDYVRMKLYQK